MPVARRRSGSQAAVPMVLVPRSRPISTPRGGQSAAARNVSHIVLTHGHADHVGDTLDIAKANGATVTTNYDLCMWLAANGLEKFNPMNTGGTTDLGGFTVTMVRADHSSGDIKD